MKPLGELVVRIPREAGYELVVSKTGGGDIVLQVMNPNGDTSRSWFMRIRRAELARVAEVIDAIVAEQAKPAAAE